MKTGLMEIALFESCNMLGDAKAGYVSLTDIVKAGNKIRESKCLSPKDLKEFWQNKETVEFLNALHYSKLDIFLKGGDFTPLKLEELKEKYVVIKRGKYGGGAWGDLYIGLKLATWLDKDLEVKIYKTLIDGGLFKNRLLGIDNFKKLNDLIKEKFNPEPSYYATLHYKVNLRCNKDFVDGWDTTTSNTETQKLRFEILGKLIVLVENNLVTKNSLLEIILTLK